MARSIGGGTVAKTDWRSWPSAPLAGYSFTLRGSYDRGAGNAAARRRSLEGSAEPSRPVPVGGHGVLPGWADYAPPSNKNEVIRKEVSLRDIGRVISRPQPTLPPPVDPMLGRSLALLSLPAGFARRAFSCLQHSLEAGVNDIVVDSLGCSHAQGPSRGATRRAFHLRHGNSITLANGSWPGFRARRADANRVGRPAGRGLVSRW